jgi:hypothetical protein
MTVSDRTREAVRVLRMSLGHTDALPPTPETWWFTYHLALRERCASLIWTRCGDMIRARAPDDLVRVWRMSVICQCMRGERLLLRVGRTIGALMASGIPAVVLKGAPFSERLYGDPFVRPTDDVDLVVPRAVWGRAVDILTEDGWVREQGTPGWAEIYRLPKEGEEYRLDLQASILVDHLDHLPNLPGKVEPWVREELRLQTYVGPEVAVLLAVHLIKHQLAPLLWLIDFQTFWTQLSSEEQSEAFRLAAAIRAHRYLTWAVKHVSRLGEAVHGSSAAVRDLGFYPSFRRDRYGMLRLIQLAGNTSDMVAVLGSWVWPRPMRYDWAAFGHMWRRRAVKNIGRVLSARRVYLDPRERSDLGGRFAPSVPSLHAGRARDA